jgi:succinate dehydrogenase / fumarate reductase cytochrome b subunit
VNKQRPVNLDLKTIKMPAAAKASILHRVSGVAMVFAVGILLWTLSLSLSSAQGFAQVEAMLNGVFFKLIIIGIVAAIIYHFLAGVRHLLMDLGYFEEKDSGNSSAKLVIGLWIVLTLLAGVALW